MSSQETLLNGRYRLLAQQGSGGMAVIYKATDLALGRTVAVKILRPSLTSDPEFLKRFRQEARNVANLSHPNIVTVHDVGQDGNTHYIVMEYVDGEDLKRLAELKRCNPKARALLFVIAEARLPRRFVTAEGKAILGKQNIPRHEGHFRVRRVCKAAASFSGKKSAHYACIIEVFCGSPSNNSPKRTRKRSRVT